LSKDTINEKIAVIGLGYVGLPLGLAFARRCEHVVGFDIDAQRVQELTDGFDRTREAEQEDLCATRMRFSADVADLAGCTMYVVTVPTPIDDNKQPDLTALRKASETVGRAMSRGAVVVYESTVYPGVTEEFCGPVLECASGLKAGEDFHLAYSPERVNPGDKEHTLDKIVKVVSANDSETLERVAAAYEAIITAGIHRTDSIRVGEAAKVIENVQRDLNIALVNELALIFDRMNISTIDVLRAAGTKWNFLHFRPGLVGGHCIGVDPYYLTAKATSLGYHPQVILAGRRLNDAMGGYIAQRLVKLLIATGRPVKGARVGVLGITFKENVPDIRNSRVPDIVRELEEYGVEVLVHDPMADAKEARHECGCELRPWAELTDLDGMVLAVTHKFYVEESRAELFVRLRPDGAFVDVKSAIGRDEVPKGVQVWSL
jgi:UDP-N-acetyl-D-glucosamine/UDP-N-acetyl-D-galactosamine dehydrogenase